jgi:uncharacterized protein YkwD
MPARPDGMARGVRTTFLVIAVAATAIAAPAPATAGADLGDLLGIITGGSGGSSPPESGTPQPGTQPSRPPTEGPAPQSQPVPPHSKLLAPESRCPGQDAPKLSARARSKTMVCMLSYARVAKHRPALHAFKPLHFSATEKARDIMRCQRLSHEACGRSAWFWFERVGFFKGNWMAGEVLADGGGERGTVLGTIRSWLGSPPHRAVLLHPRFNLIGVGTVRGRFRGFRHMTIWVGHFGYRHG